jgi:hypothetical protein
MFLGPVKYFIHEGERLIKMVWLLQYPVPVEMFEENKRCG